MVLAGGCANQDVVMGESGLTEVGTLSVDKSYLESATPASQHNDDSAYEENAQDRSTEQEPPSSRSLAPLNWQPKKTNAGPLPREIFSASPALTVAAEGMPVRDFAHYIFGELLEVNYVLDPSVESVDGDKNDAVTLSISKLTSPRDIFDLASELLVTRGVKLRYGSDTFFIYRPEETDASTQLVIGIGGDAASVPQTVQKIMQVIPLKFGIKLTLERTLRSIIKAKITPDFAQSTLYIEGSREEILSAIELIDLLDTPAMRGRYIGLVELTFIDPREFAAKVLILLENEGIDAAVGRPNNKNLTMVPLDQLGALAVFATDEFLLNRVKFWVNLIDIPGEGLHKQYFLYNPRHARAVDLDKSIRKLLDLEGDFVGGAAGGSTGNAPLKTRSVGSAAPDDINMVVDEMANLLIFYATGQRYRALLPLLKKLDVMPRQVMLDITIAEVTMKDVFKHGVEWALSRGEVTLTTQGAFGAADIGGIGLIINGNKGPLTANSVSTSSLVNVLSRPSLMVRDGVSASINVGTSISVVGSTTQDPINGDRQNVSSEYRQTGVDVSVKPTVNSAGIVLMEVSQSISNSVPGTTGSGGNPDIFERAINTEVLARSGQTILLGGLISENSNSGGSGTPGLSRVPLLGNLFKSKTKISDRTELIILITPKVIEDLSGWEPLMEDFRKGMKFIGQ
jgi:general secretion pathway protein D